MAGKRKSGNHDRTLAAVLMITAILNLVKALVDLISNLIE